MMQIKRVEEGTKKQIRLYWETEEGEEDDDEYNFELSKKGNGYLLAGDYSEPELRELLKVVEKLNKEYFDKNPKQETVSSVINDIKKKNKENKDA